MTHRTSIRVLLVGLAVLSGFATLAARASEAEVIPIGGRVLLPWGEPLAEAEVALRPSSSPYAEARAMLDPASAEPTARTRTDAEGRFSISAPGAGLWTVRVEAPGFVPAEYDLLPLIEPQELPDAEMTTDSGLTVHVLSLTGAPVADARIIARSERSRFAFLEEAAWHAPVRHGQSGEDGRVVLPRGENERVAISVSHPDRVGVERRGHNGTAARITLAAGNTHGIEVRGAEGKPIADVVVALGEHPHPVGATDAAGRFDLVLDPAETTPCSLIAADGRRLETRLDASSWKDDAPKRLVLPARSTVSGRLIDADTRRAIAGGVVWDSANPAEGFVTGGDGGFVLSGPLGSRLEIRGGAPGYLGDRSMEFQLADDGRPGPTLALAPAAAIEGKVSDADGNAVAGVAVELSVQRAPSGRMRIEIGAPTASPRAISGATGKFRLSPVDPDHGYLVHARAPRFAPAETAVGGLEPRRTKSGVVLKLDRGRSVSGTVVDSNELSLRDVSVVLTPQRAHGGMGMMQVMEPGSAPVDYSGTTDGEGRFRIDGIPAGKFDLEASRAGFARKRIAGIEVGGEAATSAGTVTLEPGQRVQGVVLDRAGAPLEGVEVFVSTGGPQMTMVMVGAEPGAGPEPDAVSDPGGWFTVDDLAADEPCSFRFERTGYIDANAKGIKLPRLEPLEVRMDAASDVSGTVVSADGEPISGARVNLERSKTIEMGNAVFQTIMMMSDESDAEGRFTFADQEPGSVSLSAVASGYQEAELANVSVPKGEDVTGIELPLVAGAIVEGRVLLPDGRPAIGAEVRKVTEDSEMAHFGGQPTDGNGYYRLEGLAAGPVSIEATHESWPRVVRDLELREGIQTLDLPLEGGVEVAGLVVATDGEPIVDATVGLALAGRQLWGGPEGRTAADGTFSLPGVPDGDYQLFVEARDYAPSSGERHVAVAGRPVYGLEVVLDSGGAIAGRVTGIEPEKFGSLTVRAVSAAMSAWNSTLVDSRGGYRIEHLRPGTYDVVAELTDSGRKAKEQVVLDPGVEEMRTDLRFADGLTLTGRAVEGDAPVIGAMVMVEGIDVDRNGWGETGERGGFVVDGLESGRYRLKLRDWQTGLAHDEILDLATSREIVIEIPSGAVAGRVRDDADRQALAGVALTLVAKNEELEGRLPSHTGTTDLTGRFVIANVADGAWRLSAEKQGYAAIARTVSIEHGRSVDDLDLTMEPTEGMTLETRLPSGMPPDEVLVAVLDAAGAPLVSGIYATGESGRVRLGTVPAGSWEVLVGAAGAATADVQATAPGAAIPVALEPASGLRVKVPELQASSLVAEVRVADERGAPFRSLEWNGRPVSDHRMYGGQIEFASLPPGRWAVTVAAADGRTWQGQASTSGGATSDLVLE